MYIAIISGCIFLICCMLVGSKKTDSIDQRFSICIIDHRNHLITPIMHAFTELGKGTPTMVICLSLLFLPERGNLALPVGISVIATIFLSKWLKTVIHRERPKDGRLVEESDFSFPSAHALTSAALYGSIALHMGIILPQYHILIIIVCILIPLLIGFSRIYLGIHYLFDVLGGWSLGLFIASLTTLFL